jgi:CoA:oxalate CoA-transferase
MKGSKALEGIRVLDLSQFLSGPRCTQILAMAGAEVIKIEPPTGEAMRMLTMATGTERMMGLVNPNKKCMVLDLRPEAGREVFKRLVAVSDVVVENFAPGTMERMSLDYNVLSKVNNRLVYAAISGYGRTGPYSDRLAFDIIAQATSGIMAAQERPERPPAIFFADLVSGAYCAAGILMALIARERTGRGQLVDISMQDVMYFHHFPAQCHRALESVQDEIRGIIGKPLDKLFSDPANPVPFWNSYRAKDGYVVIVALTDQQWRRFMEAIGRPELGTDERFSTIVARIANAREGVEIVSSWMSGRSVAEIVEIMYRAKVPCGPVLDKEDVNTHPQLEARGMLASADHPRLGRVAAVGSPVKLSETPLTVEAACPDLGADTESVLQSLLGMAQAEIESLKRQGVIA